MANIAWNKGLLSSDSANMSLQMEGNSSVKGSRAETSRRKKATYILSSGDVEGCGVTFSEAGSTVSPGMEIERFLDGPGDEEVLCGIDGPTLKMERGSKRGGMKSGLAELLLDASAMG